MNKNNIRLSEKHGVNPSRTICLYCGNVKGIALMGRLKGDQQAPQKVVIDYEPCPECQKMWDKGIPVLEVTYTPSTKGQPFMTKDAQGIPVYPTGAFMVLSESLVKGKVGQPTLCLTEDFQRIFNDIKKAKEQL